MALAVLLNIWQLMADEVLSTAQVESDPCLICALESFQSFEEGIALWTVLSLADAFGSNDVGLGSNCLSIFSY